jgi:PAS domain S-box-containing protein
LRNAALGSMAELVGKTDFDMPWATTEAEAYRADDLAVMVSGEAKLGTIETLHRQDGTTIWVETNKLPLRNLAGEVIGLLGTYQDITDRRTAELAQERQLAAIEAAVDGIAILQDGRYLYLNSAHATMFGYASPQELVGQSWRVLYSPEELERFDQDILPVLHQHMSWQGEVLGQRKDGTTFPEQLSLTLSADNLLICVCQDISERARLDDERKQTALALQHSETRFRRVFASNVVGMMFTEFSGLITDANDRFLAIIGYSRADLEARRLNWTRITPPEYAEIDQQAIAHLQRYGEIRPFEKEYLRPDGSRVAVLIGVAMLSQETGLCVCVVVDISVRKAAEAELRHTNAALERATRLKDEFLANMSHELRTPLNAILGMTEGLQEEVFGPLTDRQRRSLNTIERSGTHLLSLINDILDLSKVEAGQLELEFTYLDVSLLCNSSLTFVKQQALKKNLQLEAQIPQNLPNLYGDELRLRQVLINLLTNAVKFTPSGGCITLSATYAPLPPEEVAPQQTWVHPQGTAADTVGLIALRVADTGIGISPTNAQKLFQPFVQIDSALNRQYTGTGLGLSLVKRITEMHGGQVDLVSEVGVGSCFTVQLPIMVPISGKCLLTAGAPATPIVPAEQTKAPLILLAEDNEANVQTTTAYLTAKGYRLVVAQNGHGAVNLAQTAHPDLILMDIQMPGISGLEAIRQIRQIPALANIPIIALTALAMPKDQERCLAAGANEYISKPIRFQQLFQSIQTLLSQG